MQLTARALGINLREQQQKNLTSDCFLNAQIQAKKSPEQKVSRNTKSNCHGPRDGYPQGEHKKRTYF